MFAKLAVLLLCAAVLCSASDVQEGHAANFAELTKEGMTLVEFYAPWCGHCKQLAPHWEKAATALKGVATLVKVDATVESALASQHGIRGYPTIKVFRDGQQSEYDGGRTTDAIVAWVKKRLGPSMTTLESEKALNDFKAAHRVALILHLAETNDNAKERLAAFEKHAKDLRDNYNFGVLTDASAFGDNAEGSVVLYKQFDEGVAKFTGNLLDPRELTTFIGAEGIKLMDEVTPDNYRLYVDRGAPLLFGFIDPKETEENDAFKALMSKSAANFKGKISFTWLDGVRYSQMAQKMGLTGKTYPAVAIDAQNKHFAFSENTEITEEAVTAWCRQFLDGTLPRTIKSAPIPEPATEDGLTTVVGDSFEQIVLKSGKDVLIEFYAPWCGHCKQLAPIYKKLASQLKDVPTLTIAHMDATTNDPSGPFDVQGFPTIYFVPDGKHPMAYEGDRTVLGFLQFMKKHATHPITVEEKQVQDEL